MTARPVCAVIVTYHPTAGMVENILRIRDQVQGLVVVDNGSNADELSTLQTTGPSPGFQVIGNTENLGIAEALNQGVRWAMSEGYLWVILFDQDTTVPAGFVRQMFGAWESHPERERVASVHPKYVDPQTGIESAVRRAPDGGPIVSMTSGALMPTWIFEKIGWFASEYFIDWVDFEYCCRLRTAGYLVADSREAELPHSPGRADKQQTFLGRGFRPTHHNAMRRYYLSRNRIAVYRKYFSVFPGWVLWSMYDSIRETVKCFLGEEDRARKLRNFLLGTWDGLTGRMGQREDL
jgi:rhamnosyltransferase